MSRPPLASLLSPASIAIVGASTRPGSIGDTVLRNVIAGGFGGPIFAVHPEPVERPGVTWVSHIADLPSAPDIAVICCPSPKLAEIVEALGRRGTRTGVILADGLGDRGARGALRGIAEAHGMRLLGPDSVGLLVPSVRLNASFAARAARPGRLAFLSQSGALVTAMLDWADARGVGFSGVVALGDMIDVDFADLIDLYTADPHTDAILLYVEEIGDAARFLSAARAATLIKPVIAIKAGRTWASHRTDPRHRSAMHGDYDAYAAAFRRGGIVMVDMMADLFDAAQVLSRYRPCSGSRVAVVTNGGGAGVLTADALDMVGARLASLAADTIKRLDQGLPSGWSQGNPVDVLGDARGDRVEMATAAVLADPEVDAVLVVHCPTGLETSEAMAEAVIRAAAGSDKPVIGCWLGPSDAGAARASFDAAGLALFETIEGGVRGFGHLHRAAAGRAAALKQPSRSHMSDHDRERAQAVITGARLDGREWLFATEARAILAAYGVPMVPGRLARTVACVAQACDEVAAPYAIRIDSPDLRHGSDVGGVVLNLPDTAAAMAAARQVEHHVTTYHPWVRIIGFEVQPMVDEPEGIELRVGVADDPIFGPVLSIGAGGKAGRHLDDRAVELPPLDDDLARAMIARTRIARLLVGDYDVPAADRDGVVRVLEAVSAMVADLPDIMELDIDPLLVGRNRVTALGVKIRIASRATTSRMAIRPAPAEWIADLTTRSGVMLHVRPVRPDDEALLAEFFHRVSSEDLHHRFLAGLREVGRDRLVAMTQIYYRRAMHFLAFADDLLVASAMLVTDPDHERAEVALAVDQAFKGRGVSWTLMQHVIAYARAEGIEAIESLESADNRAALSLEHEMGFETVSSDGAECVVRRDL